MTQSFIKLSVIVACRNDEKNIEDCIESLLSQNFPKESYEIIIVENNSTDNTLEVIQRYRDNVKIVKEPRIGISYARNKGISAAKGGIIVFIDSDCIADNSWVLNLYKAFKLKKIVAVAGEIKAYNPTSNVELFYEKLMSQKRNLSEVYPYAVTANIAFRRKIFQEISFDNEIKFGEDVDFCWNLQNKGFKIAYQPKALVYHKNVKTNWSLFKKTFIQSLYIPKVMCKNVDFLEKEEKLNRIGTHHFKELFTILYKLLFSKTQKDYKSQMYLKTVLIVARKFGLICGSVRFRFLYI